MSTESSKTAVQSSLLRQVTFHDRQFLLLVSNMVEDAMPVNTVLTTAWRHLNFLPPYAWVKDGCVIRWGKQLGEASEIVLSNQYTALTPTPDVVAEGMAKFRAARGWTEKEDPGEDF